jgi:hypothetical protein
MSTRTIARMFDSYTAACAAVRDLEAAGFRHSDISLVASQAASGHAVSGRDVDRDGVSDTTESGAGTGATVGAAVGGGVGLLAGIGALAIPGIGPLVAAGWLAATLVGAGAGAATGGMLGALASAGVKESDAHIYAEGVRRGSSLVTVQADTEARAAEADAILLRHHPADTQRLDADWRAGGWSGRYSDDSSVLPRTPDGTPGNPPGTMASRAVDRSLGTNVSGAYPNQSDGTSSRPTGTAATRGTAGSSGQTTPYANDDGGVLPRTPDGTPGNPPGTQVSRGVDQALGTNISGAHPENSRKG